MVPLADISNGVENFKMQLLYLKITEKDQMNAVSLNETCVTVILLNISAVTVLQL